MESTQFLAQVTGVFSIAMGLSMAARRKMLTGIFQSVLNEWKVYYLIAAVYLILGIYLAYSGFN